jgi:hypothetical protein
MSSNLILNEQTKTKEIDTNNDKIFNYNFIPLVNNTKLDTNNIRGVLQNYNYDISGNNIGESTILRNGKLQNLQKRELDTRLFPGAPLLLSGVEGHSISENVDLSSKLKYGEETRKSKSANGLSSYSADNFIPLVPSIAENIQNVDHIIPTYWVRGGMSSRSVIRNIDYLKSCGKK